MQPIRMMRYQFDRPVEIWPLSDLHVGSQEFDEARFRAWSKEVLDRPNRHIVINGDIIDNGIKASIASPYESTMTPKAQRDYAAELLYPLRKRILCGIPGNHEYRSRRETDTDPMELIMSKIGLEDLYRPEAAFLLVKIGKPANGRVQSPVYSIGVVHGASNGMTPGAGVNKMAPYAMAMGVDLLIMGHTHKPIAAPVMRYEISKIRGTINARQVKLLVSTAFLQYGGYGARKMMLPTPIAPNYAMLQGGEFGITLVQQ